MKWLSLPVLNYFDDFPMVLPEPSAEVSGSLFELFLVSVGWELAQGKTVADFMFVVLGVAFKFYPLPQACSCAETGRGTRRTCLARNGQRTNEQNQSKHLQGQVAVLGAPGVWKGWQSDQSRILHTSSDLRIDEKKSNLLQWLMRTLQHSGSRLILPPRGPCQVVFTDVACEEEPGVFK
eukprot:6491702-Amphidinium_carterae.2